MRSLLVREHITNIVRDSLSGRRPQAQSAPAGPEIGREASRLLAALGCEGAYALPDPTSKAGLIVRSGGDGISVGCGQFPASASAALVRADLADAGGRSGRMTISAAGRARLRREEAGEASPYLAQHLDLAEEEGIGEGRRTRDAGESPLAWMARRRDRDGVPLIDAACYEAGERLRRDLTIAALMPRVGSDWSGIRVDGSGPRDPAAGSDTMLAARQRVRSALEADGNDLSGLLVDLCGFLKGLERIEAERRWPVRSAKVVARIALGRLAEHYGLDRQARGPDRSRIRLWRE